MHIRYTDSFKKSVLDQLKTIHPRTFEHFSKKLLEAYKFRDVVVTQYSKDGGIDGYGKLKVGLDDLSVAFQCKRWNKNKVSIGDINKFRGRISGKHQLGIIFTTSYFSKEALNDKQRSGTVPLSLIDGKELIEIMIEMKLGIDHENIPIYTNTLSQLLPGEV